jgi:hypothetical protein
MGEDRRRPRNETLRKWIDQGARCPFCASLRLDVDPTTEIAKTEPQADEPHPNPNEPYGFMRVNCLTCGYVSFFDPAKFGPPSR